MKKEKRHANSLRKKNVDEDMSTWTREQFQSCLKSYKTAKQDSKSELQEKHKLLKH